MRKIRYYKQHSPETCGVCCMLMALDAFGVDYPTIARERQLYAMLRSKAAPGTEGASLALGLARRHLDVTLVHSCPSLIDNRSGYYPPDLHQALLAECQDCIRRGEGLFTLEAGVPVTCQRLRQELAQDRLVILQVLIPGDADGLHDHVLHGVLLHGCDERFLYACDPWRGRLTLTDEELEREMEAPVGRMFISIGQKKA